MNIVVCGGRCFDDYAMLCRVLDRLFRARSVEELVVVSGMAKGADSLGAMYARSRGISVLEMPADWNAHGKSAGFIRNREMVAVADAVVAFWDGVSRGTQHTINLARAKGIRVVVVRY